MSYSEGNFVVNRNDQRYGEVLKVMGGGAYRVRYPVYDDPDRDYDIIMEDYRTIRPISLGEYEAKLHAGYLRRKQEWHVPVDPTANRVHNGSDKYYIKATPCGELTG